jgi:SPP1 gp7 family putative phage head morphogenesis protein
VAKRRRNRRPVQVEKSPGSALATSGQNLSGRLYTAEQVAGLLNRQQETGALATPLPRDQFPYAFGPNIPLVPAPLDPTRRDGRAEPRLWEYPVSWNLPGHANRLVPWKTLRDAAGLPLIRDCIRIRKEEVRGLEWDIVLSRRAVDQARREKPDAGALDVERELRDKFVGQIDAAIEFWQTPDRGNGFTFTEWLCAALEEILVLDALPIYPRRTLGGELYSLEVLDGTTIKPLLDHRGGRPMPPEPAYQQNIHGFPRGEFMADTSDTDGEQIPNAYAADQLIYIRREVRTHTPYGLSPVEQSLLDIDTWMKRVNWIRSEYTEGVMPAGWLINEQTGHTWTPGQVREYERELNDYLSGNTAARHRYRVLPPGFKPDDSSASDQQAEKYKPEFDLFLIKMVAGHFDLTAHELGFVEAQGLGGEGHAEGQDRINERKGRRPALRWIANLITDISRAHLGLPRELEFQWLGIEDESDSDQDEDTSLEDLAMGGMTLNELRDRRGLPRYTIPEADKPAIISATGTITFVEGAEERAAQAAELEARAVDLKASGPAGPPAGKGPQGGGKDSPPAAARSTSAGRGDSSAKAAEAAAYRKWAKGGSARRFQLEHIVEPSDLEQFGIDPARVTFVGKADAPQDGALDRIAAECARELRHAALAAVDCDELAAAWLEHAGAEKGLRALVQIARAWLAERVLGLGSGLRTPVRAAVAAGWTAGEREALDAFGYDARSPSGQILEQALDAVDVTITSVADTRLDELAEVLATGVEQGLSGSQLGKDLRDVLDAPQWAETVAVTETARAMSAASQATYLANNVERKTWLLAPDQRVCDRCDANAAQGAIPTTDSFASGDAHPPAHPNCRCALMPVVDLAADPDLTKARDRYQLREYWLRGEGAARWKTWTDLYHHLREHVNPESAKRMAASWYHARYGRWPGEKRGHDD